MPLGHGHSSRHLVESNIENPYDPQNLEIQNLHRQVETLSRHLDQIEPQDLLFDELASEGVEDFSVYSDRPDDDGDFEDLIYDNGSDVLI